MEWPIARGINGDEKVEIQILAHNRSTFIKYLHNRSIFIKYLQQVNFYKIPSQQVNIYKTPTLFFSELFHKI